MKIVKLYILIIVFFPFCVFSQQERVRYPFNEVVVSLNKVPTVNSIEVGYYGCGFGINRRLRDSEVFGFVFGIHFNHSKQFVLRMDNTKSTSYYDIFYNFNSILIPWNVRFKLGEKKKVFFEAGCYVESLISSKTSFIYSGTTPI